MITKDELDALNDALRGFAGGGRAELNERDDGVTWASVTLVDVHGPADSRADFMVERRGEELFLFDWRSTPKEDWAARSGEWVGIYAGLERVLGTRRDVRLGL